MQHINSFSAYISSLSSLSLLNNQQLASSTPSHLRYISLSHHISIRSISSLVIRGPIEMNTNALSPSRLVCALVAAFLATTQFTEAGECEIKRYRF